LALLAACDGAAPDADPPVESDTPVESDLPDDTDPATDTPDAPELPAPATVRLAGTCPDTTRVGTFSVESYEDYAYAAGVVHSGILPTQVYTLGLAEGECRIWRRENPFCDPNCEPGFTCDLSGVPDGPGQCVPYPVKVDVGTATVLGLLQAVAMTPVEPGFNYYDTTLPNPPWTAGETIQLDLAGAHWPAATLYGVAPETISSDALAWLVTEGEALVLTWEAGAPGARTEVVARLRIDQHGTTPSNIECRFADDGEGVVPASIIDELLRRGVTGFPAGDLIRRTVDSVEVSPGACVELQASSWVLPSVDVAGYTPCNRDSDCPLGFTCNEPIQACEPI
jgi:hypothetical protein